MAKFFWPPLALAVNTAKALTLPAKLNFQPFDICIVSPWAAANVGSATSRPSNNFGIRFIAVPSLWSAPARRLLLLPLAHLLVQLPQLDVERYGHVILPPVVLVQLRGVHHLAVGEAQRARRVQRVERVVERARIGRRAGQRRSVAYTRAAQKPGGVGWLHRRRELRPLAAVVPPPSLRALRCRGPPRAEGRKPQYPRADPAAHLRASPARACGSRRGPPPGRPPPPPLPPPPPPGPATPPKIKKTPPPLRRI